MIWLFTIVGWFAWFFFKWNHYQRCNFVAKPSEPIFLRFIDHHTQLFPMFANHRSSDAMFAMYRSSVLVKFPRKTLFKIFTKKSKEDWSCVYVPTEESFQPIWLTLATPTTLNLAGDFFKHFFFFLSFYFFFNVVDDFCNRVFYPFSNCEFCSNRILHYFPMCVC